MSTGMNAGIGDRATVAAGVLVAHCRCENARDHRPHFWTDEGAASDRRRYCYGGTCVG